MRGFIRPRGATFTAYWSTTDPATGKRVQHSKGGFKTQGSAKKHLNLVVGKVEEGAWRPDQPVTVAQLLVEHWLPAMRSRGLRPATITQYEGMATWYLVPQLGGLKAAALTPADIDKLVQHIRTAPSSKGRQGLSPRTAQAAVATLKAATLWAAKTGLLGRDPLAAVDAPRREQLPMKTWTADEARQFLAHAAGDPLEAAWALFLTRPLRRGEVAGLRWDAVHLDEATIEITRTRLTVDGKAIEGTPKTASGRRSIPLDARLVSLLRAHEKAQKAAQLRCPDWQGEGHVFADEWGRPWHPDYFGDRFRSLVEAAGLPRIRVHDTRHTACSLMVQSGVPVKVVQELAGHASPAITMALYVHTVPSMGRQAGEELTARLLG
ncbi:MAG: tyrosine-type recombinase/integrase [Actinomycetota bacterium]|jgi:integrase|nr:tyrosine-type recombinase/integrase [Actinomycetota bacterium]